MTGTPASSTTIETHSPADVFATARQLTAELASPLSEEDCCVQSQPCCSPVKWHLGHTTWFFERFVLCEALGHKPYDERFGYLFNSYYNTIGDRHPRACRGLLTRPGLGEIMAYRSVIDEQVERALRQGVLSSKHIEHVMLGLDHEQQHQELLLMDVKHLFSCNPLNVEYVSSPMASGVASPSQWREFPGGLHTIGVDFGTVDGGFDNESPAHRVFLEPYELADRLVTNGEFLEFVLDGGYQCASHWLDLGWAFVSANGLRAPLYWRKHNGAWQEFTLRGWADLDPVSPVVHISLFEADAFAKWSNARLPTEFELEAAWNDSGEPGAMLQDRVFHPRPAQPERQGLGQMTGDAWEWTSSSYGPYPGYSAPGGAIGEYNGKFMCNQYVLRGGSCATPRGHIRKTYRNYFEPEARWAFSGVRLARSI